MDPPPEHEIIWYGGNEEKERVLDRLRRNDPTLKELTISIKCLAPAILHIFDAIATSSSLKVLSLYPYTFLDNHRAKDRLTRALITNTSVKHLRLNLTFCNMPSLVTEVLDIIRASPNLEALTLDNVHRPSIENSAALAHGLCAHTNLHSLTIQNFAMDSDCAAAFATAFQANQTIKTLIMGCCTLAVDVGVSFAEALPHDHSLEAIIFDDDVIFDEDEWNEDQVVSTVRTLCRKHLKNLSLVDNSTGRHYGRVGISQDGCDRIIQILKANKHSFVKLDLFPDDAISLWQNNVRLEMEELTWNNYLQGEKEKWLDQFLGQDARTKELLFRALERATKLDNERFSKAPNILFHLVKQLPDSIVQAMHDGHKT